MIIELFNNLTEKVVQYKDYRLINPEEINFRNPTPEEEPLVKKIKYREVLRLSEAIIFIICILIVLIIFNSDGIVSILLIGGCVLLAFAGLLISKITKKGIVTTGTVALKCFLGNSDFERNGNRYRISVVLDDENKTLCKNLLVGYRDYRRLQEGSKVIIIKNSEIRAYCIR